MQEREKNPNTPVNESMILRDGEYFNRKQGIGFFTPDLQTRFDQNVRPEGIERAVWLPAETKLLKKYADNGSSTLVEGSLGSGKSALIYGLRAMYRDEGTPYAIIDGHYLTTKPEKVESTLVWAQSNDSVVFWDSLDYLYAKSRKVRKQSIENHGSRTQRLSEDLNEFIDSGGVLIATTHTKPWINRYSCPDLVDNFFIPLKEKMITHPVRGKFDTHEEMAKFYAFAGFEDDEIKAISEIEQEEFDPVVELLDIPNHQKSEIRDALLSYRIAKLIALDGREDAQSARDSITEHAHNDLERHMFLLSLAAFINSKNAETHKKMGEEC